MSKSIQATAGCDLPIYGNIKSSANGFQDCLEDFQQITALMQPRCILCPLISIQPAFGCIVLFQTLGPSCGGLSAHERLRRCDCTDRCNFPTARARESRVRTHPLSEQPVSGLNRCSGQLTSCDKLRWLPDSGATLFIKVYSARCLAKINRVPGRGRKC